MPVGNYTRQMLTKASADPAYGATFSDDVLKNLVSNEANVKQVVTKVELGEADVGVVYGSDVTPSVAPKLKVTAVPATINVIAEYPIALTREAPTRRPRRRSSTSSRAAQGRASSRSGASRPVRRGAGREMKQIGPN